MPNDPNPPPRPRVNPAPGAVSNTAPPKPPEPQIDIDRIAQIERELDQARQQIAESTAKIERALDKR